MTSRSPYIVGKVTPERKPGLITKIFKPFTLSCVMVVQLDEFPGPGLLGTLMVLEIFDRRLATHLGEEYDIGP